MLGNHAPSHRPPPPRAPHSPLGIAVRELRRRAAGERLVNLLALALGTAVFLVALLLLRSELGYDRFHQHAGRIYRMYEDFLLPGKPAVSTAFSPLVMAPTLRRELPEVIEAARILPYLEGSVPGKVAVRLGRERQGYEWFSWADESVFRIFTLPMVAGDPATALALPNTVVLGESVARRYFEGRPPLGSVLRIDTGFSDEDYRVTGVFKDLPYNSHFHPHVMASFRSLDHVRDPRILRDHWWANDAYTYVLLGNGVPAERLASELPAFVARHYRGLPDVKATLHMQRLTDIHLRSHLQGEIEANGDVATVHVLTAAAAAALLIALLNFMALTTARDGGRAGEWAAIMATLGARRRHLFARRFAESLVLAILAMAAAAALVWLALPGIGDLTGQPLALPHGLPALLALAGLALLSAAAAGAGSLLSLPAAVADPSLARTPAGGRGGGALRGGLVAIELAIATALLAGAATVAEQVRFMRRLDLGLDQRHVLVVPMRDIALRDRFRALGAAVARGPGVLGVAFSSQVLGHETPQTTVQVGGSKSFKVMGALMVDPGFTRVLGLHLAAGRALQESDAASGFLVNEAAVRLWDLGSPRAAIGKALDCGIKAGTIVGVVRDFHHQAVQHAIEPLIMHIRPLNYRYMYVKVEPRAAAAALRHLDGVWRAMVPDKPCERFWLNGEYDRAYQGEERLARLAGVAGLAALVLACCAVTGFAAFVLERRARQLAIRRALGSSRGDAVELLAKRLAPPAIAAVLGAWTAAWLAMRAWLAHFAYRTTIPRLGFAAAAAAVLAAAWLAASWQCRQAARADAAAALREY
jgi:putative ABC transport system permease protein